jgi:hypothetical protein
MRVEGLPMVAAPAPEQNRILNALPADARERLFPHLRVGELLPGKVLYEPGELCVTFYEFANRRAVRPILADQFSTRI